MKAYYLKILLPFNKTYGYLNCFSYLLVGENLNGEIQIMGVNDGESLMKNVTDFFQHYDFEWEDVFGEAFPNKFNVGNGVIYKGKKHTVTGLKGSYQIPNNWMYTLNNEKGKKIRGLRKKNYYASTQMSTLITK